jgi:predicted double-glycine peptidase
MVLEYMRDRIHEGFPELDVATISETIKTSADEGGTTFENIKLINEKLKKTMPSLEFIAGSSHQFEEIKEEIKNDRPVIAWVTMPSPHGDFNHSIVITGYDDEKLLIYCNDPVYGRENMPIRKFMDIWENSFRILIKIQIGEKKQRLIEEYVETLGDKKA